MKPKTLLLAFLVGSLLNSILLAGPLDDPQNCQPFDDTIFCAVSERDFGPIASDEFVSDGTALTQVRVWGFYFGLAQWQDCAPPLTVDHFQVRVLRNDMATGRRPDSVVATSSASAQLTALPESQVESTFGSVMYQIDLTLNTPIAGLSPGEVYWLEVTNELTNIWGQPQDCYWFWSSKNQTSTSYSWLSTPYDCPEWSPRAFDQAFCLNVDLGQSPVGSLPGACCTCDGACSETTLKDCEDVSGQWNVEQATCSSVACPSTPVNDNCADGPPLVGEGEYPLPQACATTDGYGPIVTEFGSSQIEGDTWYKFIAPPGCQLQVSTCPTNARCFDSMLAVYHNPDEPTVCPPCALLSDPNGEAISMATLAGMGCDENCAGEVTPDNGFWIDLDQLGRHTLPGECFLIRAGSFPGSPREVEGRLIIDCLESPPTPQADPSGINKTRFISFEVPSETTGETAIRVNFERLHYVVPPYPCDLCGLPFFAFEGLSMWVGPPQLYLESSSSPQTFYASSLQCVPHYQDWSTVGLLHVTGSAIVPSSVYQVEQVAAACEGEENRADCQRDGANVSGRLQVRTTRWGDVATPYNPPSPTWQPDLGDVSVLVDKFRNTPSAISKVQAMIIGTDAFGTIDIYPDFGFTHISACVDSFRGAIYPHRMGRCAVGGFPCSLHSDCTWAGGAGPCELYCP